MSYPPPPPPPPPPPTSRDPKRVKLLRNDYNQNFLDTGGRPQNFIRDAGPKERFAEYPKLERLIQLKDDLQRRRAHPPMFLQSDLLNFNLMSMNTSFDVILVDPPWEEYRSRVLGASAEDLDTWSIDQILNLPIGSISETPSFCLIWAGSNHLDDARTALQRWGFRRCEDIVWCKTNRRSTSSARPVASLIQDDASILQRTKEHCLMGIKGTVRRSSDSHFIHANVDTDVVIAEEPLDNGSTAKPTELYDIIERFCLGRKKLELFGRDSTLRSGWVTVGRQFASPSNWDPDKYASWFAGAAENDETSFQGGRYVGTITEIEALRPRSPRTAAAQAANNGGDGGDFVKSSSRSRG